MKNKWFAIFRAGTDDPEQAKWPVERLARVVEQYSADNGTATIQILHDKQVIPAQGFVKKLRLVGKTLWALPERLTADLVEAARAGAFHGVSASFSKENDYLNHVAFIPKGSGMTPVIGGLPAAEFAGDDALTTRFDAVEFADEENILKGGNNLDPKDKEIQDLKTQLKEAMDQIAKLEANRSKPGEAAEPPAEAAAAAATAAEPPAAAATAAGEQNSEFGRELKLVKDENLALKARLDEMDCSEFAKELEADGQLLPAQRTFVVEMLARLDDGDTAEFATESGKREKLTARGALKKFLKELPKIVDYREMTKPAAAGGGSADFAAEARGKYYDENKDTMAPILTREEFIKSGVVVPA